MHIVSKIHTVAITSLFVIGFAPLVHAEEPPVEQEPVCTADQVLPGFGFLPITFSKPVVALLGGDPDQCVTPVGEF